MDDKLPQFPGYALRRAANATAAALSQLLSEIGLRQSDASVLILIGDNPLITASALGRQLDIQRANMVPLLKRMEGHGWILREKLDGKSQGVVLTPDGMAKHDQAIKVISEFETELLQRVPTKHRAHLLPALNALWS